MNLIKLYSCKTSEKLRIDLLIEVPVFISTLKCFTNCRLGNPKRLNHTLYIVAYKYLTI